jgi:hypothetical protein
MTYRLDKGTQRSDQMLSLCQHSFFFRYRKLYVSLKSRILKFSQRAAWQVRVPWLLILMFMSYSVPVYQILSSLFGVLALPDTSLKKIGTLHWDIAVLWEIFKIRRKDGHYLTSVFLSLKKQFSKISISG